jgi:hypothetical protein
VKSSAPHSGQCRSVSAGEFPAEIDLISLANSARSTLLPAGATENAEIDPTRRRAADLVTRQV